MSSLVSGLARWVGGLATTGRFAARTLTSLNTNPVPAEWRHVTKVDPEDRKKLPVLFPLYLRHTDAVSVGGSSDVNARNTEETFELLGQVPDLPAFHEPSAARHVTEATIEASEFLAIPEVLNGDSESLVGTLGEGTAYIRDEMVPSMLAEKVPSFAMRRWGDRLADFLTSLLLSKAVFEAYVIQNTDSAAAREGNVTEADLLSPTEARQRAMAAERHLESELVYVEYSGTFGGDEAVDLVASIRDGLTWSRLWYGGGLDSRENVRRILDAGADTVVVGDVFHDVADEEWRFFEDARADGVDATFEAADAWLADEVAVEDTAAARYLSTIPGVDDPVGTARQYLARTVHALLALSVVLDSVEADADGVGSRAEARALLADDHPTPVERYLVGVMGDDGRTLARAYATDRLAERLGVDGDGDLPVGHLGAGVETVEEQ